MRNPRSIDLVVQTTPHTRRGNCIAKIQAASRRRGCGGGAPRAPLHNLDPGADYEPDYLEPLGHE
jgi:hypothetical protein